MADSEGSLFSSVSTSHPCTWAGADRGEERSLAVGHPGGDSLGGEQRARGFSLGACDYLVKPVESEHLVNVVRRVMAPGGGDVLIVDDDAAPASW